MRKLTYLLTLALGIAFGIAWTLHHNAHPSFPQLPEGHLQIGALPPEGTSTIKMGWNAGIPRVGSNSRTPRVWRFYQELDVSAVDEYLETWDASKGRHFSPHSTLIHRIFDHYQDSLREQVDLGGFGWGHSRLRNPSYISGTYCSVPTKRMYQIDVWRKGMNPDAVNTVSVQIMMIPDVQSAEWNAEQPASRVQSEGAPSD